MKGGNFIPRGQFVSCLKARKMIAKWWMYTYQIIRVMDVKYKVPSLESVPLVRVFLKVFQNDLPGIPPKWEVDFDFDLLLDT